MTNQDSAAERAQAILVKHQSVPGVSHGGFLGECTCGEVIDDLAAHQIEMVQQQGIALATSTVPAPTAAVTPLAYRLLAKLGIIEQVSWVAYTSVSGLLLVLLNQGVLSKGDPSNYTSIVSILFWAMIIVEPFILTSAILARVAAKTGNGTYALIGQIIKTVVDAPLAAGTVYLLPYAVVSFTSPYALLVFSALWLAQFFMIRGWVLIRRGRKEVARGR